MKPQHRWIVVANASCARIFQMEGQKLEELKTLIHPESRLHEQDLNSSAPGRDFSSTGVRRHAMEPKTSQKEHEYTLFAKMISDYLEEERKNNAYSQLYIAASPNFLGMLRQAVSSPTASLITKEFNKDLVHLSTGDILEHISNT
ncbi:MAG: host attachment protein [Chlamydiales bacterium]|nr:host attachment protein [Chlamydiales bacterium]